MSGIDVTDGLYFNEFFEKTYSNKGVPFNEALMVGAVAGEPFGEEFCACRAAALGVSVDKYRRKTDVFYLM